MIIGDAVGIAATDAKTASILSKLGVNTEDSYDGDLTLYAYLIGVWSHLHANLNTYPKLADPILLTKGVGVWGALPTPIEIIPANTINTPFDLHFASVDSVSANGNYIVQLYKGAIGFEVATGDGIPIIKTAAASQEGAVPLSSEVFPANTRISASISSNNAALNTLNIKLMYHRG